MPNRIEPRPNGPILVSCDEEPFPVLHTADGESMPLSGTVALCRCGHSASKPLCDGSHGREGYDSTNRCEDEGVQTYESAGITVRFNRSICSGAAECVRGLPAVFRSGSEDWIDPSAAPAGDVIGTIERCPSGALSWSRSGAGSDPETGPRERADRPRAEVRIVRHGPYLVQGPIGFAPDEWGTRSTRDRFALCRCGKSANAPFCDYSHGEQNWRDDD